jgi:hypothetical protein
MEILPYFLTSPGQHAFDPRTKTSCEAQAVERCLASSVAKAMEDKCEADAVGPVERGGLSVDNERMALMGRMRLTYGTHATYMTDPP